jgi:glycogen operon protein
MAIEYIRGQFTRLGAFEKGNGLELTFSIRRGESAKVMIYNKASQKLLQTVELDTSFSIGRVYSVFFKDITADQFCYLLEDIDGIFIDPYTPRVIGRDRWMKKDRYRKKYRIYGGGGTFYSSWEDKFPGIKGEDCILYKLHMRGFTMQHSLPADLQGNYKGMMQLIPYLKDLGVNTIEFMPLYEFEEARYRSYMVQEKDGSRMEYEKPYGTNYWGYGRALYFAPKASYFGKDPQRGMEELVEAFHREGLEIIMEFSFPKEKQAMDAQLIDQILRFWHIRYHIDGFHLLGEDLPIPRLMNDPFLYRAKIFADQCDPTVFEEDGHKHFFYYNDGFMYPLRRLQNHMDGSVAELANQIKRQNKSYGFVNYAANTTGFTLLDAYSYGEKHNEANGEDNRDGSNYNCSFNHGVEGPSRSRGVLRGRMNSIRSALALTILSQGIPLICSGDEALNSQKGNNNPYGQDNPIGWTQFSQKKDALALTEYVKNLIRFRKEHAVLSDPTPRKESDYLNLGIPDLSYHGREPWIMGIGEEKKGLGILYCGGYGRRVGDDVMLCMNFYYGEETFALPSLPKDRMWFKVTNTSEGEFYQDGQETLSQQHVTVPGGSVTVLIGKKVKETKK